MSSLITLVSVPGLLDVALKSAAVVLLAVLVAAVLGRASAAWRHLVWCLSVVSLLLLPILSLVLPGWRVAWLPQWTTKPMQLAATEEIELAQAHHTESLDVAPIVLPPSTARLETVAQKESYNPPPATIEATSALPSAVPWLALAWPAGGLLSLVPLGIGLWQLAGLHRRSQVITDYRWLTLLDALRHQLAVRRRVELRKCESALAPLTWGALPPVLLIPFEAGAWPDERRRLVLLHELAHVRRWDWLTQLLAHFACAVYWFNPLVWLAARQMHIERERACDDIVLASGVRASDYARELLALAAGLSDSQVSVLVAVPMAHRRLLDKRLHGILDGRRSRAAITRAAVCLAVALAAAVMAPLAMLRAAPPESTEARPPEPKPVEPKKEMPTARVETLEMTINTSRILTIGKRVPRAQVDDPEVVEITASSETQIKVMAKKPGVTQVSLFDEDNNVYTVDTIVYPDGRELNLLSRTQFSMDLGSVGRQVEDVDDGKGPPEPLALDNPEPKENWDVTLEEALRTALANSKTLRNLGGVLCTPAVTQSKTNHAASQDANDAALDPNAIRGTKVRFVLARTNEDIALADFQAGVRNIVSDVERAYWDLYYNYRNLNAVMAGRDSALATWRKVHALWQQGVKGGEAEKEAQAREQYFLFRAQVENTLGLLYTAEGRLRCMMGLNSTDGYSIRPSDEPTTEEVRFDWNEVLSEGLNHSVELRRGRWIIKQNELKLADARRAMSGVENAELILAKSKALVQDQELELKHVLTNSIRDLDRNYQVSRTTLNRRVAAAAQVEAVKAAYEVGTATLDMLLDAQRRLADAKIAYHRALVDYNVAILQVHYRKGSLLQHNGILATEGTSEAAPLLIDPFRPREPLSD
jgi:beta-lactamase regulating signal transducer with metallopeptidase domain